MAKKHCMFQCALQENGIFGYTARHDIVEDTGLITWEEAVELWNKYKPQVMKQLEDGQDPEMCIWTGCEDTIDYKTDSFHVDKATEVRGGEFAESVTKIIDPSNVTMGEPVGKL